MSHKVFFSYTFQDHELAELMKSRINEFLPSNFNEAVDVIDARMDVAAGADIRQSIKANIEAASTVVIISSENADASPWVNYEVGLADAMDKNIIVVVQKQGSKDTALLRRFSDVARIIEIKMANKKVKRTRPFVAKQESGNPQKRLKKSKGHAPSLQNRSRGVPQKQ